MTFDSSRRPCDSEAFATSSYDTYFAQPLSAATFVSAEVSVVLPWSMWPMVPTLTCGLLRSNFSLAIIVCVLYVCDVSIYSGADDQNRTGDLVLTKDALCQLSYIGLGIKPYGGGWSGRRGSNPRPTAWKAVTLPLSYSRLRDSPLRSLAATAGKPASRSYIR